jgi:class 3 adenylate cyclase
MRQLSAILIIDGETTHLIRLPQGPDDNIVDIINAAHRPDATEHITAEVLALILPTAKRLHIDESSMRHILQAHGMDPCTPITVMTTQKTSEDCDHETGGYHKAHHITPVNGHRLMGHIQPALELKHTQDDNLDELSLITEHFAKFAPRTAQRLVRARPENPALSKCERDVSVLFLDICDYTYLSEKLSLKALNRLVEHYFSTFLDRIHEADGEINEISGDGFMAIFQDVEPQKHAVKAADAALALLAATDALNMENDQQPLRIHLGLNSGLSLVGLTCFEGLHDTRWTFTASGPVTNLAAHLAGLAKPGQVLVGPETAQRLEENYDLRKLTRKSLKNLTDPVDIYSLVGALHTLSDGRPTMCRYATEG